MHNEIQTFTRLIETGTDFVLTTHINPDGDAIGSETALARFLTDRGKRVHILNQSATPENLSFLNDVHRVLHYDAALHADLIVASDRFFVMDCNARQRFAALTEAFDRSDAETVIIDHHLEHESFADLNIIDTDAPATCELLYLLLHAIDPNGITFPVATALYTGIMTDTQSFRLPLTDEMTHIIAADLLRRGVQSHEVYQHVYENGTLGTMQLLGAALDSIALHHGGLVAVMTLTRDVFRGTGTKESDVDNLTAYVLGIKGVRIGIVIVELDQGIKISFRSKGTIPVNELAKQYGGGGHRNAAGARLQETDLASLSDRLLRDITAFIHQRHIA